MHARPLVGSSPKVYQGCALWWGTFMRNFRIVAKKMNEKCITTEIAHADDNTRPPESRIVIPLRAFRKPEG